MTSIHFHHRDFSNIFWHEQRGVFLDQPKASPPPVESQEKSTKNEQIFKEESFETNQNSKINKIRELQKTPDDKYILLETIGGIAQTHNLTKEAALQVIKEVFPNYNENFEQQGFSSKAEAISTYKQSIDIQTDKQGFAKDAGKNINNPIEPIIGEKNRDFFNKHKKLISSKLGTGTLFVGVENNSVKLGFKNGKTLDDGINVQDFTITNGKLTPITKMTTGDIADIKKYNSGNKGQDISKINLEESNLNNLSFVNTMQEKEGKITPKSAEFLAFLKEFDNKPIIHDKDGNEVKSEKRKGFENKIPVYTGRKFTMKNGEITGIDEKGNKKGVVPQKELSTCTGGVCTVNRTEGTAQIEKWKKGQVSEGKETDYSELPELKKDRELVKDVNHFNSISEAQQNGISNPLVVIVDGRHHCKYCTSVLKDLNTTNIDGLVVLDKTSAYEQTRVFATSTPYIFRKNKPNAHSGAPLKKGVKQNPSNTQSNTWEEFKTIFNIA